MHVHGGRYAGLGGRGQIKGQVDRLRAQGSGGPIQGSGGADVGSR